MKSRTFINGTKQMQEIRIEAHGSGGELGLKNIQILTGLIEQLKEQKTPKDVNDHFMIIMGYLSCCMHSGFLDEKSSDELMQLTSFLAGQEQERAEKESGRV